MSSIVDLRGLDRLISRVRALGTPDASPLMMTWQRLIIEDNRRGVLAGLDKDGNPMRPVTYRPVGKGAKPTKSQKNNAKGRRGVFGGIGPNPAGTNNNLRPDEYRRLSGPPLAPRGAFSRVITNLRTGYEHSAGSDLWTAYGFWDEVVSVNGRPFLSAHFRGAGRLPVRDLRGVRPEGREKARRAAIAWMSDQVRVVARSA